MMSKLSKGWQEAQRWELGWWGDCTNTYGEEEKQLLYASRMGLKSFHNGKSPYNFDLDGMSILDIGGGPVSLLLKCINFRKAKVVDPTKRYSGILQVSAIESTIHQGLLTFVFATVLLLPKVGESLL